MKVNAGKTITLTGLRINSPSYTTAGFDVANRRTAGCGTIAFAPDADGKGYFRLSVGNYGYGGFYTNVDLSGLTTLVCANAAGTGVPGADLLARTWAGTSAASPAITIGRTDGATQTFAGLDSVAGTRSGRVINSGSSGDWDTQYLSHVVVNASGTAGNPNKIVFKREGLGGINFEDSGKWHYSGGWIASSGSGVAQLTLEGNLTINTTDINRVKTLWNMQQVQVQLAGEFANDADPTKLQQLRWVGVDKNAGGTGDKQDFTGYTNNLAMRKLTVGGDAGLDNYVNFDTTPAGSALYAWGVQFKSGAYLNILNADDFIYYLGGGSEANGLTGMGLVLPSGKTLADLTNRPGNIIMLGKLKYLDGDCNEDGSVNFTDYQILEAYFGATTGATWSMGDFNGDEAVTFTDYQMLEANFGSSIPEPCTLGLLVFGVAGLSRMRRP